MVRYLSLIVFAATVLPSYAMGEKINAGNASNFSETTNSKWACKTAGEVITVGQLKGKRTKGGLIGKTFRSINEDKLSRQITKLEQKADRSGKKGRKAAKQLAKKREMQITMQRLKQECSGEGPSDFAGDPTLQPYGEVLTLAEVNHILDKVAFGGTDELRAIGLNQGLTALVDALVDGVYTSAERQAFENTAAQWEALGRHQPDDSNAPEEVWTTRSVQGGEMWRMVHSREPFKEWMALQLSAHFATNLDAIGFSYDWFRSYGLKLHVDLIRDHALGNFRDLALAMFTDPAMNYWLGNKDNSAESPNQNYARELLELFTLGAIHPYTLLPNYGEDTIVAATGFVSGFQEDVQIDPYFQNQQIDISFFSGAKDSTSRTAFAGISGAEISGNLSARDFLDHVLYNHPGSAIYVAERIAGNMLYPGISQSMAEELARDLTTNGFDLKPMLKKVMKSQAMFSALANDSCMASPVEQFVKTARRIWPTNLTVAGDGWSGNFGSYLSIVDAAALAGQSLFAPPSVFGWKRSCNINRNGVLAHGEEWVSAQLILQRSHGCAQMFNSLNALEQNYARIFGLTSSTTTEAAVQAIASKVYDLTLSVEEQELFVHFLTHYTDNSDPDSLVELEPRWDREWYLRMKIPAVVCAMGTIYRSTLR
ncbi:MAG: DUF1800 family protein [Bdellovibrionales bacterium]|nr:DUF1800 family protein [Bdellovibrionales bacterium]